MSNEDRKREAEFEKTAELLNHLLEKNASRFGGSRFKPASLEDAVKTAEELLKKGKRLSKWLTLE